MTDNSQHAAARRIIEETQNVTLGPGLRGDDDASRWRAACFKIAELFDAHAAQQQPLDAEVEAMIGRLEKLARTWMTDDGEGKAMLDAAALLRRLSMPQQDDSCGEPGCSNPLSHKFCADHWFAVRNGTSRYAAMEVPGEECCVRCGKALGRGWKETPGGKQCPRCYNEAPQQSQLQASEWMQQQLNELEKERPSILRWVETGIRPKPEASLAFQKPKSQRRTAK